MKKILSFACAIAVGVALCSSALADITDNSGAGFSIPDNDPAGVSSSITIAGNEVISNLEVTLFGAAHTWVGDLVVTISNGTTTADLMRRTGNPDPSSGGFGDSDDLGGDYTFADGEANLWTWVDGNTGVIPSGRWEASTTGPVGVGTPVDLSALFGGQSTLGTWTLAISDNAGGDIGDIQGWGISFTSSAAIPEPGSLALLGVMGVACIIRRRR
jgi:hypothetical protein